MPVNVSQHMVQVLFTVSFYYDMLFQFVNLTNGWINNSASILILENILTQNHISFFQILVISEVSSTTVSAKWKTKKEIYHIWWAQSNWFNNLKGQIVQKWFFLLLIPVCIFCMHIAKVLYPFKCVTIAVIEHHL